MAQKLSLHDILSESLSLLEEGQASLEECLARYPEHASELRPLLEIALELQSSPLQTSSTAAFTAGFEKMLEASVEEEAPQMDLSDLLRRYVDWIAAILTGQQRLALPLHARSFQLAIAAATAVVLLALGGLFLQSLVDTDIIQTSTLAQVDGAVQVLLVDSDVWSPALDEGQVQSGDRIRTGTDATAQLVLFDGSLTELSGETEISVAQMSSRSDGSGRVIVLHQQIGQTYSRVRTLSDSLSRFEIETPSARVLVGGTEFLTVVESDGTTRVVVAQGVVDVMAQDVRVSVLAGQQITVRPGEPPGSVLNVPTATSEPPNTAVPTREPTATALPPTSTPSPTPSPAPTVTPLPIPSALPMPSSTSEPPPPPPPPPSPPEPTPFPTAPPPSP